MTVQAVRGVRVGAISCITNAAAGISEQPLSHGAAAGVSRANEHYSHLGHILYHPSVQNAFSHYPVTSLYYLHNRTGLSVSAAPAVQNKIQLSVQLRSSKGRDSVVQEILVPVPSTAGRGPGPG